MTTIPPTPNFQITSLLHPKVACPDTLQCILIGLFSEHYPRGLENTVHLGGGLLGVAPGLLNALSQWLS